jgi:hypothetical protein
VLKAAGDSIIGGFIAVDTDSDIRMDFSIKTLLEDNRPYMMQTLFQALEADGAESAGLTDGLVALNKSDGLGIEGRSVAASDIPGTKDITSSGLDR